MSDSIIEKARFYGRLHVITGCGMIVSFFIMLHAMLTLDFNGIVNSFPVVFTLLIIDNIIYNKFDRITDQIIINLGDDTEEHF